VSVHPCVRPCMRACVRLCVRVCVRAGVRASVHASVLACVHAPFKPFVLVLEGSGLVLVLEGFGLVLVLEGHSPHHVQSGNRGWFPNASRHKIYSPIIGLYIHQYIHQ
jgi:hypothetical protein